MSILSHHFQQQRNQQQTVTVDAQARKNAAFQLSASSVPAPTSSSSSSSSSAAPTLQSLSSLSVLTAAQIHSLALVARQDTFGWETIPDVEVLLRKFDMALEFGPCTGISRMDRWKRSMNLGLNPPAFIPSILDSQQFEKAGNNKRGSGSSIATATTPATTESKPVIVNGVGSFAYFHTAT